MPRISFWTFAVISACASAISSRTSSCIFSVTSWIARPSSEICGSVIGARGGADQAGEQEGAGEGGAHEHLGALGRGLGGGRGRRGLGRGRGGGGLGARRGGGADARRGHRRRRSLGRLRGGRALRGVRLALGLLRLLALLERLGGGLLGLLARLALLARELLGLLLGLFALLLGAAHVRLRDLAMDLRDASGAFDAGGLGGRLVLGRGGVRRLRGRALLLLLAHSGGSSPKARTQIR